ncbi:MULTISPECIES: hypothetical protein [Lacrimispora]|jgi:hypothetical protein|uniref:hypothetical protein n=1 Tax=Lacrimispora TaxID=2719231 RepID=UPI000BE37915|nr:hypothetical protein [Lacrimispora amygdalina]MDK2967447.1 sugar system component [Lacrimispora sp.]
MSGKLFDIKTKYLNINIFDDEDDFYNENMPYYTISKDKWELQIYYRAIGKKSEGPNGLLFYMNMPVSGLSINDVMDTSIGKIKYYGKYQEGGKYLWEPTGFNYSNSEYVLNSWDIKKMISFTKG